MKYAIINELEIRSEPSMQNGESFGLLYPGYVIDVIDETEGEIIEGNKKWYKDSNGFFYWSGAMEKIDKPEDPKQPLDITVNYNQILQDIPSDIKETQGKDTVVAILDTGCFNHPDLADNIIAFYDAVNKKERIKSEYVDDTGHGTFVAGLIASNGKTTKVVGVAPKSKIIIVKVSQNGGFFPDNLFNGLNWLFEINENKPDIVNMSFSSSSVDYRESIKNLLLTAIANSTILVGAGEDDETLFGNSNIIYPASENEVIAVGSMQKESLSIGNLNPKIDYIIPRLEGYASIVDRHLNMEKRGSSFASAIVSGIYALVKSRQPDDNNIKDKIDTYFTKFSDNSLFLSQNHLKVFKK